MVAATHRGVYRSPIGRLAYAVVADKLTRLYWLDQDDAATEGDAIAFVHTALDRYFYDAGHLADIPIASLPKTAFQRRAWRAITSIPPGTTRSYGALARQLQTSARAIGQACRRNPVVLFIPCHRVVAAHGIGGYSGRSPSLIKQWLLTHEGVHIGDR